MGNCVGKQKKKPDPDLKNDQNQTLQQQDSQLTQVSKIASNPTQQTETTPELPKISEDRPQPTQPNKEKKLSNIQPLSTARSSIGDNSDKTSNDDAFNSPLQSDHDPLDNLIKELDDKVKEQNNTLKKRKTSVDPGLDCLPEVIQEPELQNEQPNDQEPEPCMKSDIKRMNINDMSSDDEVLDDDNNTNLNNSKQLNNISVKYENGDMPTSGFIATPLAAIAKAEKEEGKDMKEDDKISTDFTNITPKASPRSKASFPHTPNIGWFWIDLSFPV